jgi:glycosyltransferase involved in cell wall biosynthesis
MAEKIRVLFTIPNFITAGSGGAMLNIIERLDPDRFICGVCVSKRGGTLDARVEALGVPFIVAPFSIPARPYVTLPSRAKEAAQAFRGSQFDIWHSFHYTDDYTEALIARHAGAQAWVFTKKNMGWASRAWKLRSLLASGIAAQNSAMMRDFFGRFPFRKKSRLIPRGVDTTRFTPEIPPRLGLREQLHIPSDTIVVGCVAQLVRVKGHPTLLKALAKNPGLVLLLAGSPHDRVYAEELKTLVTDLDLRSRVHFLGDILDVPAFLAEIDIAVLPTWGRWRMEGCPVALLEAMACGKPCIATRIPGSEDIVIDQESGILVPPEDDVMLANALASLAGSASRRTDFGRQARLRIEEQYSIEREVKYHEALYYDVLGKGSA